MKTKLFKLTIVLSLCLAIIFVFTACKDKEIYAGSDDFQSYPEYWNDFNDDSGDITVPNGNTSNNVETPGEDPNANFTPDDEDDTSSDSTSSDVDTDDDGTPDSTDPDDDNDGTDDSEDTDDDNDGTPDSEEKPDYGNQGPLVFF